MEKTISVKLVRIVVPIIGSPGDHLMLLGDVCVGVDTSRPAFIETRLLPAPEPRAVETRARRRPGPSSLSREETIELRQRIEGCFESGVKLMSKDIHQKLGLKSGSGPNIYYYLQTMVKDRILRSDTVKVKDRRLKRYWLSGIKSAVHTFKKPGRKPGKLRGADNGALTADLILSKFKPDEQMSAAQIYSILGLKSDYEKIKGLQHLKSLVQDNKLTAEKSPNPAIGYVYRIGTS